MHPHFGARVQPVGADDRHAGIVLGNAYHLFEALGQKHIVGCQWLAVLALGGNLSKRDIVILDHAHKDFVAVDPDPAIVGCVLPCNIESPVRAAIVNDGVVPTGVRLGEHTFDALAQIAFSIENWSHYAD